MKLHTAVGIALAFAAVGLGTAHAEDNSSIPSRRRCWSGRTSTSIPARPTSSRDITAAGGSISSRIIFLNRYRGGCQIRAGFESSINNTSSIISGNRTIGEFAPANVWNQVVQCVRNIYAPFDIEIVDQDPGSVRTGRTSSPARPPRPGSTPTPAASRRSRAASSTTRSPSPSPTSARWRRRGMCWTVAGDRAFVGPRARAPRRGPDDLPGRGLPGRRRHPQLPEHHRALR